MSTLKGLLDRLILLAGFISGGLVPGFVLQYRQRLGGHLRQVTEDLKPFEAIAERYHEGSLEKLFEHHLASADPTFQAEGAAIRQLLQTRDNLAAAWDALGAPLLSQLQYLAAHADPGITYDTWMIYQPTLQLGTETVFTGATLAFCLWLLFHASWWVTARLLRLLIAGVAGRAHLRR